MQFFINTRLSTKNQEASTFSRYVLFIKVSITLCFSLNSDGLTPLDVAVLSNNRPLTKVLLAFGAREGNKCKYCKLGAVRVFLLVLVPSEIPLQISRIFLIQQIDNTVKTFICNRTIFQRWRIILFRIPLSTNTNTLFSVSSALALGVLLNFKTDIFHCLNSTFFFLVP